MSTAVIRIGAGVPAAPVAARPAPARLALTPGYVAKRLAWAVWVPVAFSIFAIVAEIFV